ncbi:MAG TPA: tetratricopeptide repeat protein, partial [Myxococcaceae bacterium]|nr:tetratricopeptide repeat protein [Myxococcaceae bacterium]
PRAPAGHEETAPPRATMLRSTITQPGTLLGTPPYMPPEQLRGELGDARSDQFSFCVALYHALYGEFPFRSETLPALLGEIERRKIGEPPKFRRIPTWLRRVLLRGLSPDPAGRHESMDTLLRELAPRGRLPRRLFLIPSLLASAAVALVLARTEWDPTTEITSIAVLPLKNLSGDSQKAYFADGITEALITELGKIRALRVLSYQSVRNYRDTAKPLPQLGRELQVGAFLEGAVLQSGGRVRITINLLQSSPERHLWAESYDFDLRDVLSVQAEVARDVASRIRVEVTPPEQARLKSARRVDSDAYQSYLLGRAHMSKAPTPENWARAKEYFEKAIEKDPEYAPAYAGLAELYIRHRQWRNHKEARLLARRWGEKALQLDDTLAEAHTVLARCAQQDWDWAGTERGFRRAIELNPSYALARLWYAMYLYAMGRFDEAVVEARRAQQLDPVSPLVNSWAGAAYLFAGRAEEALASAQKALELDPSFSDASIVLARIYVTQGKYREGIDELQRALTINPRQPLLLGALAHAYARAGQRDEALNLVAEMKRIEAEEPGYAPFNMVYAYAGLGDKEQAFAYLERAYQERAGRMVWMNVDKYLDPLRSDPRFEDLVRRVGLPTQPSPQPR